MKKQNDNLQLVSLSDCCEVISDRIENPSQSGLERFVGLEHMKTREIKVGEWGSTTDVTSAMKRFRTGDILVARRNVYLERSSKVDFDGVCSGDAIVLRPNGKLCLPELLPFILNTDLFWEYALSQADGSMSKRISVSRLTSYKFTLPTFDEQRRIAELLWAVEDYMVTKNNVIESITKLKIVIRKQYFDSGKNKTVFLKDLCEQKGIQIGPFGSELHASDYVSTGIPVIMPSNMTTDQVDESGINKVSKVKADNLSQHKTLLGDILLPRRGDLDRRVFIYPDQIGWLCGTGSLRVRFKKGINARAVFHALSAPSAISWIKNNAVGTTMPNINSTIVSKIPIFLPSDKKIDVVVNILDGIDILLKETINMRDIEVRLKRELLNYYLKYSI